MIRLSASIVLYKPDEVVIETIRNLLNTDLSIVLFLVDNSPSEAMEPVLGQLLQDKRVHYIFNSKNVGFGAGHNIAIRKMLGFSKYHLVVNPDISFKAGTLERLLDYAESDSQIGMVTPKVVYPDGSMQYVCKLLPTPFDLFARRFLPSFVSRKRMSTFELHQANYDKPFEAPYIHGCFMFIRTDALKHVGLFDERFFMYPEDIDLTRRVHKLYKTMYFPGVVVVHKHARQSYKKSGLLYVHIINMIKYFNKWGWFFDPERKVVNKKILEQF